MLLPYRAETEASAMRKLLALAILIVVAGCSTTMTTTPAPATPTNPLLAQWSGPYGGTPPFDKIKVADMKPALEIAMAENLAEVDAIAKNPAAPTFENTI